MWCCAKVCISAYRNILIIVLIKVDLCYTNHKLLQTPLFLFFKNFSLSMNFLILYTVWMACFLFTTPFPSRVDVSQNQFLMTGLSLEDVYCVVLSDKHIMALCCQVRKLKTAGILDAF